MTTKSTKGATAGAAPATPTREEIQTAYQVHTLSQILYGHLATTQGWGGAVQMPGVQTPTGYPNQTVSQTTPLGWPAPFGWYR